MFEINGPKDKDSSDLFTSHNLVAWFGDVGQFRINSII